MSDLFHEDVPAKFIGDVWTIMNLCQQHIFLILTKRPQRMLEVVPCFGYYLPNVWMGVSVEDQETADERIPLLLQTPAAKRIVSCEPLLGPVDLAEWISLWGCGCDGSGTIDWVIVGGESGPGARPMRLEWAESLVTQCQNVGIPVFVKQLGGFPDKRNRIEEWPENLRVREWPEGWSELYVFYIRR
jgi:protein gp37